MINFEAIVFRSPISSDGDVDFIRDPLAAHSKRGPSCEPLENCSAHTDINIILA